MISERKATAGRRQFLRALAAGVAATAAPPLATAAMADRKNDDDKSRYRETDHVKAYYRVNRYPS